MWTKVGLLLVALALTAASWTYRTALADAVAPMPTQLACASTDCIKTITACRREPIAGWNDSLYAAAKAPGVELRPCRSTTELAQGD